MMIEAVVFDMDGVIFDSERLVLECWKEIADKHNIQGIEEACLESLGVNAKQTEDIMYRRYGTDFPYLQYAKEVSLLFHSRYDGGRLLKKKGIETLLTYLRERNVKLAVASSTRQEIVQQELRDSGLFDFFDSIIGGDMVERSKPAPDIFLMACKQLNVVPEETYVIEDSYNGIRAAYAANMIPIMVPDLVEPTKEIRMLAREIFPSLVEVEAFFRQK